MIQTWSHTIKNILGSPAMQQTRFGRSLSISLCASFENTDYQPKLDGLNRVEKES